MTVRRIDLLRNKRGFGREELLYGGLCIGKSGQPVYAAARYLLDNGLAAPDDTVVTYRDETLCMSGKAGELGQVDGGRERSWQSFVRTSPVEAISYIGGTLASGRNAFRRYHGA